MSEIRRPRRILTVLAATLGALLVSAAPATAAPSCGRAVLVDWSDGRIDKQYPLHCYDEAIELLPRDLSDYSRAEEDILRALQSARRGQAAPPNRTGSPAPEDPLPPTDPPAATGPETPTTGETETTAAPPPDGPDDPGTEAVPPVDPGSASSVPIPLLVLAGIALLLVAGGSAGYVLRRVQARRLPPPA